MKNTGDGRRLAKVEMEVQRTVAQCLLGSMRGHYSGLVTVTRVKMPADLRSAKVYVSVLNPEGKPLEVVRNLQECAADIQHELNAKLRMRYCPKLTFFLDDSVEKTLKVENLLKEIALEKETKLIDPSGED